MPELHKMILNGNIYGGAIVRGDYLCDLLFENTDWTPKTGSGDVTRNYTLTKPIDNYDAVVVSAYVHVMSNGKDQLCYAFMPISEVDADIQSGNDWKNMFNGSIGSSVRRFMFRFTSHTTIRTVSNYPESNCDCKLYKVWGLKFGSQDYEKFIYGSTEPTASQGVNGNIYIKTDSTFTDVEDMYFKIGGNWVSMIPTADNMRW